MTIILPFILRGTQMLFSIVVFGLSVSLIREHHWGLLPSALIFAAIVGGITVLSGLFGVLGVFLNRFQRPLMALVDGFVALINFAAGIILATKVGPVKCSSRDGTESEQRNLLKMFRNDIMCGGSDADKKGHGHCYAWSWGGWDKLVGNCRSSQADMVFLFLTGAVVAAVGAWTWLRARRS